MTIAKRRLPCILKENCRNSRTSNGIDMKLGLVTKLDKRNMATSKRNCR